MEIDNKKLTTENSQIKERLGVLEQEKTVWDMEKQSAAHKMIEPSTDQKRQLFKLLNVDFDTADVTSKAKALEAVSLLWKGMTGEDLYEQVQAWIRKADSVK